MTQIYQIQILTVARIFEIAKTAWIYKIYAIPTLCYISPFSIKGHFFLVLFGKGIWHQKFVQFCPTFSSCLVGQNCADFTK